MMAEKGSISNLTEDDGEGEWQMLNVYECMITFPANPSAQGTFTLA